MGLFYETGSLYGITLMKRGVIILDSLNADASSTKLMFDEKNAIKIDKFQFCSK